MKKYILLTVSILYVAMIHFNLFSEAQKWFKSLTWLKPVVDKFENHLSAQKGERLYISLNQPLYIPGETVWFTIFLRNDIDLKPSEISDILNVEILDPKGNVIKNFKLIQKEGVAKGDWDIPEELVGGIYTLRVFTEWQKNDPDFKPYEKTFQIQKVVTPRLLMKLNFPKRGFGPGETVMADFEAKKLDNTPLANTTVEYQVKLEGKVVQSQKVITDNNGKVQITFSLPNDLKTPDGTLNVKIPFEGQTEAIARSIPITLDFIDLKFYPEGGDLVTGLKTRVAFEALNFYGKGTDIKGQVIDSQGNVITTFESFHLGKGAFEFTPQANQTYKAKILEPKNITKEYTLPDVSPKGFILNVENQKSELVVTIQQNAGKKVGLIAQQRGKIYFSQEFSAQNKQVVKIPVQNIPAGVLHLTLFDEDLIERCERLVFINPHKKLNIKIQPDKSIYQPREKVTLNIVTTDESGLGVPANLAVNVVDEKILKMADDKQGHLLAGLLLEQDVKGKIEEPNFYFDEKEPKAFQALDLLLMTRGWRRFTWKQITGSPAINYLAEKAEFRGTVLLNHQPKSGATVTLTLPDGKVFSQVSDKDGKFLFKNIHLDNYVSLHAKFNEFNAYAHLTQYHSNIGLSLYKVNKYYRKGVAPAMEKNDLDAVGGDDVLGNFGGEVEEGVKMEQIPMAVNNQPKDIPVKEAKLELNRDEPFLINEEDLEVDKKKDMRGRRINPSPVVTYYRAREFPTVYYESIETEVRTDFRNCIYWNGNVETDNKGKASVSFYNNDAITTFAVIAEGVSRTGLPGTQTTYFACQKPFSMEVKVPTIVTMGDHVEIPLTLKNNLNVSLTGNLSIQTPKSWKFIAPLNRLTVQPQSAQTLYLPFEILNIKEDSILKISFINDKGITLDAFVQKVKTYSKGFPMSLALSSNEAKQDYKIAIGPAIEGSLQVQFEANPNPLAEALSGLENMIGVPSGCFEQTSYTNYPNVVIMKYANEYPELAQKVREKVNKNLEIGYKRLTSYETQQKGYEWFGSVPAHEALSAYGLLQFKDMQTVYASVDQVMVKRTADWLISRKDGKGGFLRDPKALDSFGRASKEITDAYIVYSLTEAGYTQNLETEINQVYENHKKLKDPYLSALCWNILLNVKDKRAEEVEKWLMANRDKEGIWTGTTHSITYSQGIGLQVETTALVGLAMLKKQNPNIVELTKVVKVLLTKKSPYGGMFGTTQGTVLTMKLLALFAQQTKKPRENGTLNIFVNGQKIISHEIKTSDNGPIQLNLPTNAFKINANNTIKVEYAGMKEGIPYSLYVRYSVKEPQSDKECKLQIQTEITQKTCKMGDAVRLSTVLKNITPEGLPMSMAIVGIPGGLTPQPQQLKELQEKGVFDFYEIKDQYIAFYYRALPPNAVKKIDLDLKADIPGNYECPASYAYLYYTPEFRNWHSAGFIKIDK